MVKRKKSLTVIERPLRLDETRALGWSDDASNPDHVLGSHPVVARFTNVDGVVYVAALGTSVDLLQTYELDSEPDNKHWIRLGEAAGGFTVE